MIQWIKNLFTKKQESIVVEEPKIKEFEFSVLEAVCIGDKYVYKVKAESKEEAFKILVQHFYGESSIKDEVLKSKSYITHFPGRDVFQVRGMPHWFARVIGIGHLETRIEDNKKLDDYCRKNGIVMKNKY